MNLKSPQYRILPQNASYLKGNLWEVSVPRHQKTGWSIVLSCLLTSELKEKLSKYIGLDDKLFKILIHLKINFLSLNTTLFEKLCKNS